MTSEREKYFGVLTDKQFSAAIWDEVQQTISKVNAGTYTVAEALCEIHNDIDNWIVELSDIVDKENPPSTENM